jgi:hypothetical protein
MAVAQGLETARKWLFWRPKSKKPPACFRQAGGSIIIRAKAQSP